MNKPDTKKSSSEFQVSNPLLWSDKTPYLYTRELQLWIATHTLKTAGEPRKLVLKEEWKSDGTDSERHIFLTLELQDEKGTCCPFAKNEVTVDISGAGELIGLDSGHLTIQDFIN